jgi:hypothetical protein
VRLRLERSAPGPVAPGGALAGHVVVEEGGSTRTLTVRLAFVERAADYTEVARIAGQATLAEGDLADGFSAPFSLTLPPDALPAVACDRGSLGWELSAQLDRFGPDVHDRQPVDVQRG